MNDKTILLKYHRKDFEEIYFRNGNGKTFLNAQFKRERIAVITIGMVFLATLIYVVVANKNGGFAIILGILFCVAFYDLFKKASPMLKWKAGVIAYLDDLDKIREHQLILAPHVFSLLQDGKETIEKWSELKRCELELDFISITTNATTYLFPKKSMFAEEFEFLRAVLSEKMKGES